MKNTDFRLNKIVFFKNIGTICFFLHATKFEVNNTADDTLHLWHERLVHYNETDILKVSKLTKRLIFLHKDDEYDVCNTQKARRSPICKTVGTGASKPLEIVHLFLPSQLEQWMDSIMLWPFLIALVG